MDHVPRPIMTWETTHVDLGKRQHNKLTLQIPSKSSLKKFDNPLFSTTSSTHQMDPYKVLVSQVMMETLESFIQSQTLKNKSNKPSTTKTNKSCPRTYNDKRKNKGRLREKPTQETNLKNLFKVIIQKFDKLLFSTTSSTKQMNSYKVPISQVTMGTLASFTQSQTLNISQVGWQQQIDQEVFTYTTIIPYIPPIDENIQLQKSSSLVQENSSKTMANVQVEQMQTQYWKSKQETITPEVEIPTSTQQGQPSNILPQGGVNMMSQTKPSKHQNHNIEILDNFLGRLGYTQPTLQEKQAST